MTYSVPALQTTGPAERFARTKIQRREARAHDVVIDIAYVGICHSDIHTARSEWGPTIYPFVPGHEIVGTVRAVGEAVAKFKPGDRVGVGCYIDSCRRCPNCRAGEEQLCLDGTVFTYNSLDHDGRPTLGGYSHLIVVDENYVLNLPEGLELANTAPLLCAGITLYAPLKRWGAAPGRRVGIVGVGGLGHLGIKLANAMGAEVIALSRSLAKQGDVARLGAQELYATGDPATFSDLAGSFDLIISTVSDDIPVDAIGGLLRTGGALVFVGMPPSPQSFRTTTLTSGRRVIAGSLIGGIGETQAMLEFCAAHGITADVELVAADAVDAAYDRVVAGAVRYRAVIDVATI